MTLKNIYCCFYCCVFSI